MTDTQPLDRLKELSKEQLQVIALLAKDKKQKIQEEPLYKHNMNNDAQQAMRDMTQDFRVLIGGNKVGKTDEMGFQLVAMCKGKCEEFGISFPHKPPLKAWYCGRDRNVLSDEPLASIKRYLKGEGLDHRTVYVGQSVQRMHIWDDNGTESVIWFKPYSGDKAGKRIFESANVHIVLMDEEPPREVFSAVKTKIGVLPGFVWIAMTPDNGLTWTYDLFNGSDPEHGELVQQGYLEKYEGTVFDNMRNFKVIKEYGWARYPEEWIPTKHHHEYRRNANGELEVKCSDTFAKYIKKFVYNTDEYRYRILGHYVSFTGKVYLFRPEVNTFELEDLPSFSQLKIFGALDWATSSADYFCFMYIGLDKDNNIYVIDSIYEKNLDAKEQAEKIKSVVDYWGVVPEMIVADNQIENKLGIKDEAKPHILSIKDFYMDFFGDSWTTWRCEEMDKRDPHIKRDWIKRALKEGKLKFSNYLNKTYQVQQEIQRLEYKNNKATETKGKDDADAALRMFMGAAVDFDTWITSDDMKEIKKVHHSLRSVRHKNEPVY